MITLHLTEAQARLLVRELSNAIDDMSSLPEDDDTFMTDIAYAKATLENLMYAIKRDSERHQ